MVNKITAKQWFQEYEDLLFNQNHIGILYFYTSDYDMSYEHKSFMKILNDTSSQYPEIMILKIPSDEANDIMEALPEHSISCPSMVLYREGKIFNVIDTLPSKMELMTHIKLLLE